MSKWQTSPLASVCAVFGDGDWIESKDQSPDGVRLVQTGNVGKGEFKDRAEKARFVSLDTFKRLRCTEIFPGDCLISRLPDPVGRACLIPETDERMITAVDCTIVRFNQGKVIPEFFAYYSQAVEYLAAVEAATTGTTRKRISRVRLGQVPIPMAPLTDQCRIVAILDEAFEGIATAKANAEKNLQNARELADALGEACFEQYSDGTFSPRELAELCDFIVDCEHKTAPTQHEGYPSIRTPNIGKGKLLLDDVNRVSDQTYNAWTRRAIPMPGDLILAREAPAGNVAVIPDGMRVCLGQRTVLIRPRREVFEPQYLAHMLLQRSSQRRMLAHSRGATVQHVNMKDIRAFKISLVPSLGTQQHVIERLADIDQACESLERTQQQKLSALDELKKSLLHQAFSGNLQARAVALAMA